MKKEQLKIKTSGADNYKIFKYFEILGDKYIESHLSQFDVNLLKTNWWEGLKFFFSKSFMRGRRDELSNEYLTFTIKKLEHKFNIGNDDLELAYEELKNSKEYFDKSELLKFKKKKPREKISLSIGNSNPIYKLFTTEEKVEIKPQKKKNYEKEIHLGNIEDIMMVFDVLNFISEDNNKKNIYSYILSLLEENKTDDIYKELISDKFRDISDKIATFIIRDIYLLNPEISTKGINNSLAFPIDTWVRQITDKLDPKLTNDEDRKEFLINKSNEFGYNPLKVAAGIWYLGANSLDLLIEKLKEVKINDT